MKKLLLGLSLLLATSCSLMHAAEVQNAKEAFKKVMKEPLFSHVSQDDPAETTSYFTRELVKKYWPQWDMFKRRDVVHRLHKYGIVSSDELERVLSASSEGYGKSAPEMSEPRNVFEDPSDWVIEGGNR
jgi:hypothetical protein